jgi:hypothetical protein
MVKLPGLSKVPKTARRDPHPAISNPIRRSRRRQRQEADTAGKRLVSSTAAEAFVNAMMASWLISERGKRNVSYRLVDPTHFHGLANRRE